MLESHSHCYQTSERAEVLCRYRSFEKKKVLGCNWFQSLTNLERQETIFPFYQLIHFKKGGDTFNKAATAAS